jgi:cyanophycin synthetase
MKITGTRRLESINYLSKGRVVVCTLDPPGSPPSEELRAQLKSVLSGIVHPPEDSKWVKALDQLSTEKANWNNLLAASAQFLQRVIVRFDGRIGDGDDMPEASLSLECLEFEVGEACIHEAMRLVNEIKDSAQSLNVQAILEELESVHEEYSLGSVTGPLVAAAKRLAIPTRRLDGGSLIQLGHGKYQRRIRRSCTELTGYISELVSVNKPLVKSLWSELGLPVASGRVVANPEDAILAMQEIGTPVVAKPCDADYGDGVTVGIETDSGMRKAYALAASAESRVIIEKQFLGDSYRLLVSNGRVISAVRRMPASVLGNGKHNITELISLANTDPNRGTDRRWKLYRINLENVDVEFLCQQGLRLDSVPARGQLVLLRRDIDHTEGGSTHEVLEHVHPLTLQQASIATQCIGLDLAGVDLMAQDISQPLHEQGGGFLEINAEPGIGLHLPPMCDRPRPVDEAIIESLFLDGRPKRIPIVLLLTQDFEDERIVEQIKNQIQPHDCVGVSTHRGTSVGSMQLAPRTSKLTDRVNAVLAHPYTQYAVASVSVEEVIESGIGLDRIHAVIIMDSTEQGSERPLEQLKVSQWLLQMLECCDKLLIPRQYNAWLQRLTSHRSKVVVYENSQDLLQVWS